MMKHPHSNTPLLIGEENVTLACIQNLRALHSYFRAATLRAIPPKCNLTQFEFTRKGTYRVSIWKSCTTRPMQEFSVFWLTMTQDIDNFVQSCSIWNTLKRHQQKESLHLHEIPELPWSVVATDVFDWNS